ncbi:hypothetical protein HDU98_000311 [Podochytrium sp. JEL0797]|nr:hypothetical protein HDU98_000311 [Podochytrium sp. JEL0797]
MLTSVAIVAFSTLSVSAQFSPGGPTQLGLPDGCVGSFPNITQCRLENWYLGDTVDQCAPLSLNGKLGSVPGQLVYIKDETNFCINLPNPDSIFLQNNYYNLGKYPTIVEAEGFVQAYCMGDYLPAGAKPLPFGGIRAAHVIKNYTSPGNEYLQVAGYLDCDVLKINCQPSAPGAYDDGGQYDNVGFINCGKEPYSGVDPTPAGNGHKLYVEQAGDGIFCMRTCPANGSDANCAATHDTWGCERFMGVKFADGFSYTDLSTGAVSSAVVSLPPKVVTTTTAATTSAVFTGVANVTAVATATPVAITKSGGSGVVASAVLGLLALALLV